MKIFSLDFFVVLFLSLLTELKMHKNIMLPLNQGDYYFSVSANHIFFVIFTFSVHSIFKL